MHCVGASFRNQKKQFQKWEKKTRRKTYGWRWHLSDAPSSFSKNRSTNPSRPWSRRLRAEKSQIPGAKKGSRTGVTQDWVPRLWTWPGHRPRQFSSFLHLSSKRKTSSKFCYFYWLHYLHLDNAAEGREGWAGSLNEDRKKTWSIPRHSHSRNSPKWSTIWVPKPCVVTSADTWLHSWHAAYQLPMILAPSWPSSKPDTSGARVFIGPPRFFSAPKEIPKEASDPPAKSACQRS